LIHVVSHYDADGICAASIIAIALLKLDKPFHLIITKDITPELLQRITACEPSLVIFTDLGSGYLADIAKLPCDIIIADHHELGSIWCGSTAGRQLIHINPELFGKAQFAGAGVAYLIARELIDDRRLAQLALVGSIGDCGDYSLELFIGPGVNRERGLNIFGRFGRPLHHALESAGFTNSIQLLTELGIDPRKTLAELNATERQKLTDALVRERLAADANITSLFTDVWTLANQPAELADAKEFATLLNALGRMGSASTGIALCMGNAKALNAARDIVREYKKQLAAALEWVSNNPVRRTQNATYILAGNAISDALIGTVVSMLARNGDGKPVIGLAMSAEGVKVSGRSSTCNVNKLISKAAEAVGGRAGGHAEAAGATIPVGTEEHFISACEEYLKSL
ncbi:MAG: DHH family phosphoesterase, partial [Candidatus Aenigmatarchaeota archaeon]